jgi:hypothetical protein
MRRFYELTGRELKQLFHFLNEDIVMVLDNDMNNVGYIFEISKKDIEDNVRYTLEI